MARKKINLKPLIVIFMSIVTLAVTSFCIRQWNRNHRAGLGLRDGIEAFENNQWTEAAENLGKYIAIVPNDVSVLMKYADAQVNITPMNINNINQALNSYRRALRLDPTHKKAVLSLMDIYIQLLNSPAEAELIGVKFLEHTQDSKVRRTLAISYYKQRKFKEARQEINRIIKADKTEVTAYAVLARFAEERPEYFSDIPEKLYDRAISASPENPLAYIVRGEYFLRQSEKNDAVKDFNKAGNLSLSDVAVRLRLARALFNAGMLEETTKHLERISTADPDNINLWQLWAKLALTNQSVEEMSEVARRGCESLTADLILFLPTAAELFIRSGDYNKAAQAIDQLKLTEDSLANVTYLQGLMAKMQGDTAKAMKMWRKIGESGPDSDMATLPYASALASSGDIHSAIIQLRMYITRENYSHRANLMLAEYLIQIGKYSQAQEQINIYLQFNPKSIRARLIASSLKNRVESNSFDNNELDPVAWDKLEEDILNAIQKKSYALNNMLMAVGVAIENHKPIFARQLMDTLKKHHPSNQEVMLSEVLILIAENNKEAAKTKLYQIVDDFPGSVKALQFAVRLNLEEDNLTVSQELLEKAQQSAATSDDAREIKMMLANVYEKQQQFDKARDILNSIHQADPSDVQVSRWLISIAVSTGESEKCQPLIDSIKNAEGQQGWQWRYEQARLWYESQQFEKKREQIISYLKENLKVNSDDQPSLLLLAATYAKAGNNQLASSIYKQALNHSPNNIDIILAAVAVMHKSGEYEFADQVIGRARSHGLTDHRLATLQLNSYIKKGDYSSATAIAEKLTHDAPQNDQFKLSLARLNIHAKKFDEAGNILNQLYQRDPNSLAITKALVDMNMQTANPDRAIFHCDKLISIAPNAHAYTLRGRTYMRLGNSSKASLDLQKAFQIDPQSIPAMVLLARHYQSSGQSEKAAELITKAVEMAPNNFDAQKSAAMIYLTSNNPSVASNTKDAIEKALQINPEDVEMLTLKARVLFAMKSRPAYSQALKLLQKATSIDPMYTQAWAIRAEVNLVMGNYTEAGDDIATALTYRPESKLLHLSKARIEAAKSPAQAIQTLHDLRQKHPNDIDIAVYLAYMYINSQQSSSAVKLLESLDASADETGRQKIEIALAEALYSSGKTKESMRKIASLYETYPDSQIPLLVHTRILKSDGKWNELSNVVVKWYRDRGNDSKVSMAVIQQILDYKKPASVDCAEYILREIIASDYDNVDALNSLGVLLHITDRSPQALKYYEKVLMLDPDRVVAINNMAWILCEEQNKYDQALELTNSGLSRYPDYADLIDTAGVAKYRLGLYEESIIDFNKCIKLSKTEQSETAGVHFHIARSLEKTGQLTEAIKHLEKAIEINKLNGGLSSAELAEANMLLSEISERY